MTNRLYRNDKFVTAHNNCSRIPPSTTVHFATRVRRSRVFRLLYAGNSTQIGASDSSRVVTFLL